jgi:transcriptional regulator with XRE-family HTH domain
MRDLREDRGLTLRYVASYLGVGFADLAGYEHGRRVFVFDKTAALLDLYGVYDRVEREHLLGLARDAFRLPRWQDDFAGPDLDMSMLDYWWLESIAARLRCYGPVLVPAPLRTPRYVEAVVRREMDGVSDEQVGWWLRTFADRQRVLDNGRLTSVRAVVAESVLYRPVGGPADTLPGQLEHLARLGGNAGRAVQVQVRVLSAAASYVPWADGWFTVFELPAPYPPRVACAGQLSGVAIHEGAAAVSYTGVFDQVWDAALGASDSVSLIAGPANGQSVLFG